MQKQITYKGKEYTIQIEWATENYCFRIIDLGGFHTLPRECLHDMEKFKPLIIEAMKDHHDLKTIELWDGNVDQSDIVKSGCKHIHTIGTYAGGNSYIVECKDCGEKI